jgi:site-specific DNA-methyltransferase (adenine-specific)
VIFADNLDVLRALPDACIPLVYIDPPFNTGRQQSHTPLRTVLADDGDRIGFQGRSYRTSRLSTFTRSFSDAFDDYYDFLEPRLREARRVLAPNGTLYVHLDYREVHYVKILLDGIFGRECFLNEIIWAYDFGGRSRRRWPAKHDNILVYVVSPGDYVFNVDEIDRIPYLAPDLVGAEKAARGKLPTDVWWNTIVPTSGRERTGYPTQKPLAVIRRIIRASSRPGDLVLDFFAGSGTAGVAARELGRHFLLVDNNREAIQVMTQRLAGLDRVSFVGLDGRPLPSDAVPIDGEPSPR